ncbi:hypothetical protein NQ318_007391 [Aromia moschata]|uniref:DUF4817 domain-containing protein n=1 Tax=Aromia moschata TaxID=1265417 RepID=A0AAV8YFQ2_9CUCU|nr:hypothetical protein NQ318_007391 [Aromia moschata]
MNSNDMNFNFETHVQHNIVYKLIIFVLQFREMVYLTEMHKITILQMIGYSDRTRTQAEVVRLFQEKYPELPPISQGTKQFRERRHVRQLKKNPPNKLSDDQTLDVMLMLEENPHTSSRQTASALNISHSSILRLLTENPMHPYKLSEFEPYRLVSNIMYPVAALVDAETESKQRDEFIPVDFISRHFRLVKGVAVGATLYKISISEQDRNEHFVSQN